MTRMPWRMASILGGFLRFVDHEKFAESLVGPLSF